MSAYKPTTGDIAMDLIRCVRYQNSTHPNFIVFYKHALKDWNDLKTTIDDKTKDTVEKLFNRFNNSNLDDKRKMEDLYTAAYFLSRDHLSRV